MLSDFNQIASPAYEQYPECVISSELSPEIKGQPQTFATTPCTTCLRHGPTRHAMTLVDTSPLRHTDGAIAMKAGKAAATAVGGGCRVAYLVNQYPKVSHTFIRREILALERLGFDVVRFAVRGWDAEVVDPADEVERSRTQYLMQGGIGPALTALFGRFVRNPSGVLSALAKALAMSRRADRALPYHLVYVAQACLLLKLLEDRGVERIHAHFGTNPAEVAMYARLLGGPPYSFTIHGPEEFDKAELLGLESKTEHAAFVVAISSYGRSQLYRRLKREQWSKIKVVHCGLDEEFLNAPSCADARPAPQFICVGRLCEQKGQLLLLAAFQRVAGQHPDARLVLAGDGEMRLAIEDEIRRLGLERQVAITGWISSNRVREEILRSGALILPSFQEGLPVVLMEAMALCRPVISTYVAGIPELVTPDTGWLVPAGDVDALAQAMLDFLGSPPGHVAALGRAGQARVRERHDIAREAAKLGSILRAPAAQEAAA